ncbi:hypothetical protein ZWY2020_020617 [Hordeum vulgare]|nr:hypothetical protein ZWY2020_020617 [Hordeum vulgare]
MAARLHALLRAKLGCRLTLHAGAGTSQFTPHARRPPATPPPTLHVSFFMTARGLAARASNKKKDAAAAVIGGTQLPAPPGAAAVAAKGGDGDGKKAGAAAAAKKMVTATKKSAAVVDRASGEFIIDTPDKLKAKLEMVEVLGEIEIATRLLEDDSSDQIAVDNGVEEGKVAVLLDMGVPLVVSNGCGLHAMAANLHALLRAKLRCRLTLHAAASPFALHTRRPPPPPPPRLHDHASFFMPARGLAARASKKKKDAAAAAAIPVAAKAGDCDAKKADAAAKMVTATKKGAAVLDLHIPDDMKKSSHVLQLGYNVLKRISNALPKADPIQLEELTGEFYTVIPHDFGFKKMREFIIDTPEKLKAKLEMVEALGEIEIATRLLEDDQSDRDDPLYARYKQLHCDFTPLEVDSEEYSMVSLGDMSELLNGDINANNLPRGVLYYNEYIVYNLDQIRMRYALQVSFNYKQ